MKKKRIIRTKTIAIFRINDNTSYLGGAGARLALNVSSPLPTFGNGQSSSSSEHSFEADLWRWKN
jgi:hypothetical protein